jgi:hypothetical protein
MSARWSYLALIVLLAAPDCVAERLRSMGTVIVEPDVTEITIHGEGCAPGGRVTARTTSMHGSANDFLRFKAGKDGKFRRKVKVPFAGEDAGAGVSVHCATAEGNEIHVFAVDVEYRCPPNSKSPACGYEAPPAAPKP